MRLFWCALTCAALAQAATSDDGHVITWNHTPGDAARLTLPEPKTTDSFENLSDHRRKRDVIEEEKYYYSEKPKDNSDSEKKSTPWIPETIPAEDKTLQVPTTSENQAQALPLYITEPPTEKPGRGARMASHDNWIKLPSPGRDEEEKDRLLVPPQPSDDLLNSRMPRVNFVTQNKRLDTSESRNERDSVPRANVDRNDGALRTDFVHPGVDSRARNSKEVYPRQALYYPEEDRRRYMYEDRYYPVDDPYRRDPYYDTYDRRVANYVPYAPGPRIDRLDPSVYDSYLTRKPKRIIYYAHLPEVVRSPPSVDMRYKYSADPYRRFEDDYLRSGRYDPRFKPRYPYGAQKKDDRASRDLIGSSTTKDKRTDTKDLLPPAAVAKKEEVNPRDKNNYNNLNSHQYHLDSSEMHFTEPMHNLYPDVVRPDQSFRRYDVPSFQAPIDDPYADRH